jgi:hypothetical protein
MKTTTMASSCCGNGRLRNRSTDSNTPSTGSYSPSTAMANPSPAPQDRMTYGVIQAIDQMQRQDVGVGVMGAWQPAARVARPPTRSTASPSA